MLFSWADNVHLPAVNAQFYSTPKNLSKSKKYTAEFAAENRRPDKYANIL